MLKIKDCTNMLWRFSFSVTFQFQLEHRAKDITHCVIAVLDIWLLMKLMYSVCDHRSH